MSNISDIYGIGPHKFQELKSNYNIRTIYSLRKYVKKIPEILSETQREGLRYHEKIYGSITLKEASKHVDFIFKNLKQVFIAGSYRRKLKKIKDIDIITTMEISNVVNKLEKKGYIQSRFVVGQEKFSGVVRLPGSNSYRKIDIIKSTKEELPFALLYFTGDHIQNIYMRKKSKKAGYRLSQYGMVNIKTGRKIKLKSEKEIFEFLNLKYKKPEDRTHDKNAR